MMGWCGCEVENRLRIFFHLFDNVGKMWNCVVDNRSNGSHIYELAIMLLRQNKPSNKQ